MRTQAAVTLVPVLTLGCTGADPPTDAGPADAAITCGSDPRPCASLAGYSLTCQGDQCAATTTGGGEARVDCERGGAYAAYLSSDARNCGACGVACGGGQFCVGGHCGCLPGEDACGACGTTRAAGSTCGHCVACVRTSSNVS